MVKKDDLQSSFATSRKNKTQLSATDIDRIAEGIDAPKVTTEPEPIEQTAENISFVKTSISFPSDLYESMKDYLYHKKISMREYINELVKNDLHGK